MVCLPSLFFSFQVVNITLFWVVTLAVWLTPVPAHAQGLLVNYGSVGLSQANAAYHGYSLDGYEFGAALMSPSDLGKVLWVRRPGGEWFGPGLSVDVASRKDFYKYVVLNHEVAEIDIRAVTALGFMRGMWGEVYVGLCPPLGRFSQPQDYELEEVVFDPEGDRWTYWQVGMRPQQMRYPLSLEECRRVAAPRRLGLEPSDQSLPASSRTAPGYMTPR